MPDYNVFLVIFLCIGAFAVAFFLKRSKEQQRAQERIIKELREQIDLQRRQSTNERSELNVILSSMVEGVLVIGRDEKIQYISPNVSAMFDFRSKEVTAKPYWEVIPHGQIITAIKEAMSALLAVSREITIFQQEDVYFNIQVSPVINAKQLMGAVAVFHDISELKRLLRMRSEFVANVSHELKTPLTSIKGYVETLSEKGALEDRVTTQKFLKVIQKQTLRLEALVKDLLTLSAIESKEVSMDLLSCDIDGIIQNALNVLKAPLDASRHNVALNIPVNLPKVRVDRHRIEQVMINLLDNAIKFTPSGGNITIVADLQVPFVKVVVRDSGIGITAEHLPRLFERFYRVDKSRSSDLGGTGLGLAIVKHIVLAHQGKVEVQSKPGAGTTFTIYLPASKN